MGEEEWKLKDSHHADRKVWFESIFLVKKFNIILLLIDFSSGWRGTENQFDDFLT